MVAFAKVYTDFNGGGMAGGINVRHCRQERFIGGYVSGENKSEPKVVEALDFRALEKATIREKICALGSLESSFNGNPLRINCARARQFYLAVSGSGVMKRGMVGNCVTYKPANNLHVAP